VKSPCLHLTFSSSSELEELSLEKLKSIKAAHVRGMIFWNFFFFFLSLKQLFFLLLPLLLESFRLV
jgi:energy-coupling factor transporter transmembrane protein EcfT